MALWTVAPGMTSSSEGLWRIVITSSSQRIAGWGLPFSSMYSCLPLRIDSLA